MICVNVQVMAIVLLRQVHRMQRYQHHTVSVLSVTHFSCVLYCWGPICKDTSVELRLGPLIFRPGWARFAHFTPAAFLVPFFKIKTVILWNELMSCENGQMAICSIKMCLFGKLEHLKIFISECSFGSIWPSPTCWFWLSFKAQPMVHVGPCACLISIPFLYCAKMYFICGKFR